MANAEQWAAIHARVRTFAAEAQAGQVVLLDMSGHVLSTAGAGEQRDDEALGALLAGLFGSARALSHLFGEDDFRSFFQQGAQTSIYTLHLGAQWLLITVFDQRTQVGLVRMLAAGAARELADLLANFTEDDVAAVREAVHSQAFRASFNDTLDRFFHDVSSSDA
jgi:predicted regulator of Ras-like GTPase activity (Roadblock/LC7/MglB family)